MKKKMKRMISCMILLVMLFAFCADAFTVSIGYRNDTSVKALKTWYATTYRPKASFSEKAVFDECFPLLWKRET